MYTWTRDYLFQRVQENRELQSERTWSCFLHETKFDFLYSSWKYLIYFCFRLNIFTRKISNLLLPLASEEARGREYIDIPTIKGWLGNYKTQHNHICYPNKFILEIAMKIDLKNLLNILQLTPCSNDAIWRLMQCLIFSILLANFKRH